MQKGTQVIIILVVFILQGIQGYCMISTYPMVEINLNDPNVRDF